MPTGNALSKDLLSAALAGLEAQRQRIDEQLAELRGMMGGRQPGRPPKSSGGAGAGNSGAAQSGATKKRTVSAAARKRMAAAQKKRWAAVRKGQKEQA
jgi:hypothetical protein